MNKRIFALLLAALLLLTASGCSKKQALPEQKTADILATTQPVYQLASALTDGTAFRFRFSSPSPSRACTTTR